MKKTILLLLIALSFSTMANAALINRGADSLGNNLIYDTDLNITWYDYTRTEDNWQNQVNWASNLSVTFGSQTFDDWRLPSTVDGLSTWSYNGTTTVGYNITSSEMGHLYYTELGNLGFLSTADVHQPGSGLRNTGPFEHLQSVFYWSGTEYSLNQNYAWSFSPVDGSQGPPAKLLSRYALAVRPGDVARSSVPEPGTWLLLGSGLAGLVAYRRRLAEPA